MVTFWSAGRFSCFPDQRKHGRIFNRAYLIFLKSDATIQLTILLKKCLKWNKNHNKTPTIFLMTIIDLLDSGWFSFLFSILVWIECFSFSVFATATCATRWTGTSAAAILCLLLLRTKKNARHCCSKKVAKFCQNCFILDSTSNNNHLFEWL